MHAAVVGTEAASNAAARAEVRAAPAATTKEKPAPGKEPMELLWFDARSVKRVRVYFKGLLADLSFSGAGPKHEIPTDDPDADLAREEILGVLTGEAAADPSVATTLLQEAVDEKGRFTPPLAVFEGELKILGSEVARLRAATSIASQYSSDKRLKELCELAAEVLGRAHPNAGSAATRTLLAIREHYYTQYKGQNALNLDAEIDRQILEDRAFDERTLFGGKHLRFAFGSGAGALPAYAAEGIRDALPLFDSMRVRMLAEINARQDRSESSSAALRVVALGRLLAL